MNPTMEGCEAMARNSKVSNQETLILATRSALVALLALFLSLSPLTGESHLLAQDPPAGDDAPAPADSDDEDEDDRDSGAADSSDAEQFRMTEGKFPVLNLLRFIQRTTGKFVNYPSSTNDQAFAEETFVDVIGDVDPLTYPIVQAILETNGYELWESTLDDGTIVINVRATSARVPVQSDPVSPIIEAGDGNPGAADEVRRNQRGSSGPAGTARNPGCWQ